MNVLYVHYRLIVQDEHVELGCKESEALIMNPLRDHTWGSVKCGIAKGVVSDDGNLVWGTIH